MITAKTDIDRVIIQLSTAMVAKLSAENNCCTKCVTVNDVNYRDYNWSSQWGKLSTIKISSLTPFLQINWVPPSGREATMDDTRHCNDDDYDKYRIWSYL